jgi:hypothetical protein
MKDGVPEMVQEHAKDAMGKLQYDNLNNPIMKAVTAYKFDRFLCFDYEMLKNRYGLRLERFSALEADRMEEDEDDEKPPTYTEGEIF